MASPQGLYSRDLVRLAGKPRMKDKVLMKRWGISERNLARIRSRGDLLDRVVHAAKVVEAAAGYEHVTAMNLAAVVYPDWDLPRARKTEISRLVEVEYQEQARKKRREYRVWVPAMQIFREDILGYEGNLYEASKAWPLLVTSQADFSRQVRIPLSIDASVAYMLGICWADGSADEVSRGHDSGSYRLHLNGSRKDGPLYKDVVVPGIKDLFNLDLVADPAQKGWGPQGTLNSKALFSWMVDCLGFPFPKKDVGFPSLVLEGEEPAYRSDFFSGLLSGMGAMKRIRGDRRELNLCDHDKLFIGTIESMARVEGFSPRAVWESPGSYHLTFGHGQVRALYDRGLLRNPAWDSLIGIFK